MDGLDVDHELAATVVQNEDADATTARLESLGQTGPEAGLVGDGDASFDIARLSHGHDAAVLDVQDTVLLENRAEHGLDDNAGGGVGDEGRLLVELLGEQINTEVTVLAGSSRGRDADDLARAALKHQDVAHADVVARDGDSVGNSTGLCHGARSGIPADLDMVVVVEYFIGHLVKAVTEGMIVSCHSN